MVSFSAKLSQLLLELLDSRTSASPVVDGLDASSLLTGSALRGTVLQRVSRT